MHTHSIVVVVLLLLLLLVSVVAKCHMKASAALIVPRILQPHGAQGGVNPYATTIPIAAAVQGITLMKTPGRKGV